MKKTPVKGTNDYLPEDVRLRDYLQNKILEIYTDAGYSRIYTPVIEDAENLDKSDGGDNLNLIFNIMKRGDKLKKAIETGDKLFDLGLRYDLTLPLSRYFANNRENLLSPAKCIQIGTVYRAERPQKGRLREFVQCDIDVIGSRSFTTEVELIHTTAKALKAIEIGDFTVKVNDRRILRLMLEGLGFSEDSLDSVCITFDKLDKIGIDGVVSELTDKGFDADVIARFKDTVSRPMTLDAVSEICGENETENLRRIIEGARELSDGGYKIEFDISLVRGQGYYTGTVFEVVSDKFNGSVAGGGRYDGLVGKFTGEDIPAVGFSIGFERIFALLKDAGYKIPDEKKQLAVFCDADEITAAIREAERLRADYRVAVFEKPKKLSKFLDKLKEKNYFGFCFVGEEIRELK